MDALTVTRDLLEDCRMVSLERLLRRRAVHCDRDLVALVREAVKVPTTLPDGSECPAIVEAIRAHNLAEARLWD